MNDTTSTPEVPDGRAGVTKGEQAGAAASESPTAPPSSSAAATPEPVGTTKPAAGKPTDGKSADGKTADGKTADGQTAAGEPAGAEPTAPPVAEPKPAAGVSAAEGTVDRAPAEKAASDKVPADQAPARKATSGKDPAAGNGRPAGRRSSTAGGASGAPGADAPTARMRRPADTNGAAPTAPSIPRPPVSSPAPPAAESSGPRQPAEHEPVFASSVAAPAPASGPVPHPGPAAASPPPWNRVPGQPPVAAAQSAPRQPGPAGGLLDGPTAYLMPDAAPSTASTDSQANTGWTPVRSGRSRPPRQAALQLKRLDPWSMLKLGLVLAVVIFFIWLVAVGVLYGVLDGMGVWDRLNGTYADLVSGEAPTGSPLISAGRVFGLAAVVGAINSLLFAVAVTIGAFVYNVSADLVGGVEVTLSERD